MSTRAEIRAEAMRRMGSFQTITVSVDPDITDSTAQRKVISSDQYSISATSPQYGQANLWVGRYGNGTQVKTNSYARVAKVALVPPSISNYVLKVYGYGTSGTLTPATTASALQTGIRAISSSLNSVAVTGTSPMLISGLPSADTTVELVRATPSDTTGSVTQGLASFEAVRPFTAALGVGDVVELLYKFPAHDSDQGLIGMNRLINQALERLWFTDLLHFRSTDADSRQATYSLSAYPWLTTRSRIQRVYAPCLWRHTFAYTVPVASHTLTLDGGFAANLTTASVAGSATATAISSAITSTLGTAGVTGSVSVVSSGTTRTVTVDQAYYADFSLTASTGATVTTTHERMESLRFADGYRLKFHGQELFLEWDEPWTRGYSWFLEVYRPAQTKIARQTSYLVEGSTWSDVTDGFESDLDQCVMDTNDVAAVAHYLACRQLEMKGPGQEKGFWHDERVRAALIAGEVKHLDLPSSNEPGFRDEGLTASRALLDKGFFSQPR